MNDVEKYLQELKNDFGYMLKHTDGYVYPGWQQLMRNMLQEIENSYTDNEIPVFEDIKDKFGTLRVYGHNFNDETRTIINKYEKLSTETCMTCGTRGQLRVQNRWLYVACEEHKKD